MSRPWRSEAAGVRIAIRLTPRGGRDAIDGVIADSEGGPLLKARVAAPPVDGAANTALIGLVAKLAGVRKSDVSIEAGETARIKRVFVAGDPQDVTERLESAVSRTR